MDKDTVLSILKGSEEPAKTVEEFAQRVKLWIANGDNILFVKENEAKEIADFIDQQAKEIQHLENTEFQREEIFLQNSKMAELGRSVKGIRPEVIWFARKMEDKLKQNDYKVGWQGCEFNCLSEHLINQFGNLLLDLSILVDDNDSSVIESIINKAVNTANFTMMIADNCRKKAELEGV